MITALLRTIMISEHVLSLTQNMRDVRMITRKHGLQRRLLPSKDFSFTSLRKAIYGRGYYLRLYLLSRKANSFNANVITVIVRQTIAITIEIISKSVISTALLSQTLSGKSPKM